MGSSFSVVIGPYLEVKGCIEKKVEKVKRFCSNHPTVKMSNEKYCPTCGELIKSEDYFVVDKLSIRDFLYEFDDESQNSLYEPYDINSKSTILLSSNKVPSGYKIPGSYDGGGVIEFVNVDTVSTNQKIWFMTTYKKYIDVLKEKLGDDKVEVKWGYIGYWS
jgi:hypothetical protein